MKALRRDDRTTNARKNLIVVASTRERPRYTRRPGAINFKASVIYRAYALIMLTYSRCTKPNAKRKRRVGGAAAEEGEKTGPRFIAGTIEISNNILPDATTLPPVSAAGYYVYHRRQTRHRNLWNAPPRTDPRVFDVSFESTWPAGRRGNVAPGSSVRNLSNASQHPFRLLLPISMHLRFDSTRSNDAVLFTRGF